MAMPCLSRWCWSSSVSLRKLQALTSCQLLIFRPLKSAASVFAWKAFSRVGPFFPLSDRFWWNRFGKRICEGLLIWYLIQVDFFGFLCERLMTRWIWCRAVKPGFEMTLQRQALDIWSPHHFQQLFRSLPGLVFITFLRGTFDLGGPL